MAKPAQKVVARRVQARRAQVAILFARYCKTGPYKGVILRIAQELGVDRSRVSRDLQALDIQWRDTQADTIARLKERWLGALEQIMADALAEWERSRTHESTEDVIEGAPGPGGKVIPERAQRRKRSAAADTRYLQAYLAAQNRAADLVGANAPQKLAPTDPTGEYPYDPGTDYRTELVRRLDQLLARKDEARAAGES